MVAPITFFINYRRADEAVFVELLRFHFMHRYGRENVFMDFDSIPPFTQFEDFIRQKVRECDIIVPIIGPRWLELLHSKQKDGKPDYVRIELTEALKTGRVIAPVCIQGAKLPDAADVPAELRPLFALNIPTISSGRELLNNIGWLMDGFELALAERGLRREAANASQDETLQSATKKPLTMNDLIARFTEALKAHDDPQALIWAAEMRTHGGSIPDFFRLDNREAAIRTRLKAQEEARRRMEVAAYLYGFVRHMVAIGDERSDIDAALAEVWTVEPGYDPDGLAQPAPPLPTPVPYPRPEIRRVFQVTDILPGPFEWCPVSAGPFKCGEKEQSDNPPRALTLPAFEIAKYAITWEQFAVFLDADDGFRRDDWWAGLAVEAEHRAQSGDQAFKLADHPRERVSWYDAMAFCRWLSHRLGGSHNIEHPNRWAVRLSTEWEWEKAARGTDGLAYPYGDQFDAKKSNTSESGIKQTKPVTAYPEGKSPCGALNMSGNVWEWTLGTYEKPADDAEGTEITSAARRVVRGGSWFGGQGVARAAYRYAGFPTVRSDLIGFRVVRLPSR